MPASVRLFRVFHSGAVDRRDSQARTSYGPSRAARDAAGVPGAQDCREAVAVSRSDPALLRALSRDFHWFGELASGRVALTKQIAAREALSHSYVRHVVPLGLLAPKVMEAICAGQQSVTISAERLKDHARFPIEWDAQQRLLCD
jgi:hypothetical protein